MKRTLIFALTGAVLATVTPPLARETKTPVTVASPAAKPTSTYPDGTGDSAVDRLNDAQINANYQGPYYHPGEPIPPERAIILPTPTHIRPAELPLRTPGAIVPRNRLPKAFQEEKPLPASDTSGK
ncbi:hypothetical protein [Brytella acorum]|uniref:Uncharacterized protein n=1 Tax=Brytella acorum TaxID=2959299 RepID=A0AA35UE47_9PROT|nr:hypothetical protein [Brytella acorum]MDF3625236.1 hypothetical protein [Brytella acorum]CAI9119352.1 hypothetical protein LMG32879_000166 [Brytella acorum]